MTITLTIVNIPVLPQALPNSFTSRGGSFRIGRESHADWVLPDPTRHISSLHAEVEQRDGSYWLIDRSTNGLFLNGSRDKLGAPHRLEDGDRVLIGRYIIAVQTAAGTPKQAAAPAAQGTFAVDFARAAGIPASALDGCNDQQLAEELGAYMRQVTEAVMGMLRERAQFRSIIKSGSHTLIAPAGNNPLKLMPDAGEATAALFGPGRAGYQRAPEALPEALAELALHQAASWHAMQGALAKLLEELAPDLIEDKAGSSAFGSRKARAWDLFVQRWMELEAGENGMLDAWLERIGPAYDDAERSEV